MFILDDTETYYIDKAFWKSLLKESASWLPLNVRFIVSATHAIELEPVVDSPADVVLLRVRITRNYLLLSDEEVRQLFEFSNGLPPRMRSVTLEELIVRESNGNPAVVRTFIDCIATDFGKATLSEHELVQYCFSDKIMVTMGRAFGCEHSSRLTPRLRNHLAKALSHDPTRGQLNMQRFDDDEISCLTKLFQSGIILHGHDGYVRFSSPLAERYYYKWLFPNRRYRSPSSLHKLTRKVIANMSSSTFKQSAEQEGRFPSKATFHLQFAERLARFTHRSCVVCPEIARVFPALASGQDQWSAESEMEFYLCERLSWGLQLVVNGDNTSELVDRFAQNGKYSALGLSKYVIVGLRGNPNGEFLNVPRSPHKITVFSNWGIFRHAAASLD